MWILHLQPHETLKRNPNQWKIKSWESFEVLSAQIQTAVCTIHQNTSWWFVRVQKLMIPRGFYLIFFNGGRSFSAAFPPSTFSGDFKPIPICCQTFLVSSKCQWDIWLQNIHIYVLGAKWCDKFKYWNLIMAGIFYVSKGMSDAIWYLIVRYHLRSDNSYSVDFRNKIWHLSDTCT